MRRPNNLAVIAGYAAAVIGPLILTTILGALTVTQSRDFAFLYIGLVAVLGIASGIGPALLAAGASFLLVDYFFVEPLHTLSIADPTDQVNLVVFFAAAGIVGGLGSLRRRAQIGSARLTAEVRAANTELARLNEEQAEAARVAVRLAQTQQQVHVLQETDRLRGELLANVSHELRTPLASLLTGTTDMLADPGLPQPMREKMRKMAGETERLGRLVSDMLDMATIEGHVLPLVADEVDVHEAVLAAVLRLRQRSPDREVTVQFPEGMLEVVADWDRLGQILDNLLANADRYAPAGTPIRVEAMPGRRSTVVTRVIDSGPGIPGDQRERIFERFVRGNDGSDAVRRDAAGTGLGLAIVRGLVEAQAGRVWIEEPQAGEGGRFAFTLPAVGEVSSRPQ